MQFSGKITNSILVHLARLGWERERLFELTEIPLELLRDPSSWINAGEVEAFLRVVEREFGNRNSNLLVDVGHSCHELRAWGVLDSVLRMMQKPQDIFSQPQRFISYFISPAPPIGNLQKTGEAVSFDLPISHQEYPLVTTYLSAALEGLPRYLGRERAQVLWRQTNLRISWSDSQPSFLSADDAKVNPGPELVHSLVQGVELAQAQIEARDLEIARMEREIRSLKDQLVAGASAELATAPLGQDDRTCIGQSLREVRQNVMKLTDYLARTHQALTFAKALVRGDGHFDEVLRRIDWDNIRSQYPWLHMQILETIEAAGQRLAADAHQPRTLAAQPVAMSFLMERVVERMRQENPAGLNIKHLSFIEKPMVIDHDKMQLALLQVLSLAAKDIHYKGQIEVVSRVADGDVEVRITKLREGTPRKVRKPDLPLLGDNILEQEAALETADSILRQHAGGIDVIGSSPEDRSFRFHWPVR